MSARQVAGQALPVFENINAMRFLVKPAVPPDPFRFIRNREVAQAGRQVPLQGHHRPAAMEPLCDHQHTRELAERDLLRDQRQRKLHIFQGG